MIWKSDWILDIHNSSVDYVTIDANDIFEWCKIMRIPK